MRMLLSRFDVRVSVAYGVVAILWIFLSDSLLIFLSNGNSAVMATVGALKGIGFITITTLALFTMLRAEMLKRDRLEHALQKDITQRTQTLEALQQSESRFATIFNSSPVPISINRLADGHFVDVNDALVELFGYARDELLGRTTIEMGLWVNPEERGDLVARITEGGYLRNQEFEARTKSGKVVTLLMSSDLIDLGDESHIVTMFYDITEQKKVQQQNRYQARLLDNVSDAVVSMDVDLHIRSWNAAAEAIYGWTADEVIGKKITDVLQPEFQNTIVEEIDSRLDAQGQWRGEIIERRKDGGTVYVLASLSHVLDSAGNRVGMVTVNKDITERRQIELALRESERRFRTMADTAPAMLWTSDETGLVTFLSHGWYVSTGQAEDSGLGWGWLNALHPEDREGVKKIFLEVTGTRTSFQVEYRLRRRSAGDYRWVIATGNPRYAEDGAFLGYIGSVIDVTERKKAQEDLQTAELMRMELEKEKELLELKERFISVVSHEFRTPLSVIISSADLVHTYFDRMPHERRMKHIYEVLAQAQFMVKLMDDVLTVNKARSGRLEFNPALLDLKAFCEATLERIQAVDKGQHQFSFTHDGDLSSVMLDEKLLQHILINLLSNAAKYSPGGSDVQLSVHRQNGHVVLCVRDHGIGIPAESLPRLFEPFYRAENTGDISGTGLGTAIVKESVDLHKGSIACESEVGVGTTFTVTLPTTLTARPDGQE